MTESLEPEQTPLSQENEKALQQLAWAIEASVGQFKLILARCNYASLRKQLVEKLRETCQVELHILDIKQSEKTLYSAIRERFGEELPACLMILGLESVQKLEEMLISANQVREEFRNNFYFPFVLWIDEQVHKRLMQFAPDLESWATTRNFIISSKELVNFIRQFAQQFFSNTLMLTDDYLLLESELEAAQRELHTDEFSLEIEANLESLLGFVKQVNNKIDAAINHYQKGLELWQQSNSLEHQGKILGNIAFCYYIKDFKNRDINHDSWQNTLHYVRKYLKFIVNNQNLELIPDLIVKFGDFLYELPECQPLEKLAKQALELHKSENRYIELARDYGFLAEVALMQKHWDEANQFAQQALDVLSILFSRKPQISGVLFEISTDILRTRDVSLYRFIQGQAKYHLGQNQSAIRNLEAARDVGKPQANLRLHLNIINLLQQLYLVLPAFWCKLYM
ncbi:hypothetical protein [Iningainema tapete]|uniref:Uncharacterized protein n=1 Tax=Iningainema tapete BLCC-T55 TaxID=2748662 RepID=A0A8J6XDG4_9CYAN|nr:hypothetical protein [Iningainema tapete]MBD2771353.1 hypothetical protein [Iningainema tapete BLCC-T55]